MARAQDDLVTAYRRLIAEVPGIDRIKLVTRVELRGRGDVQVFRLRSPGPEVTKEDPTDAKVAVSMPRSHFNELLQKGTLEQWREAYEEGHIKVGGSREMVALLGKLISNHLPNKRQY